MKIEDKLFVRGKGDIEERDEEGIGNMITYTCY